MPTWHRGETSAPCQSARPRDFRRCRTERTAAPRRRGRSPCATSRVVKRGTVEDRAKPDIRMPIFRVEATTGGGAHRVRQWPRAGRVAILHVA